MLKNAIWKHLSVNNLILPYSKIKSGYLDLELIQKYIEEYDICIQDEHDKECFILHFSSDLDKVSFINKINIPTIFWRTQVSIDTTQKESISVFSWKICRTDSMLLTITKKNDVTPDSKEILLQSDCSIQIPTKDIPRLIDKFYEFLMRKMSSNRDMLSLTWASSDKTRKYNMKADKPYHMIELYKLPSKLKIENITMFDREIIYLIMNLKRSVNESAFLGFSI